MGYFDDLTTLRDPDLSAVTGIAIPPAQTAVPPITLPNGAPVMSYPQFQDNSGGFLGRVLRGYGQGHLAGALAGAVSGSDQSGDYMRYLANALAVSGAAQQNEVNGYNVDHYRRANAGGGPEAVTRNPVAGMMGSAMAPPAPSYPGLIPSMTGTAGAAPAATSPVPAMFGGGAPAAPSPAMPTTAPTTAAPFVYNPAAIFAQIAEAQRTPALAGALPKLYEQLQEMMKSGMGVRADGSFGVLDGKLSSDAAIKENEARATKMGTDLLAYDANGNIVNRAGAVAAAAGKEGAIAGAKKNAELPATLAAQRQSSDLTARNDKGVYFDPNTGAAIPVGNYSATQATIAGDKANAELPSKIVESAAKPLETRPGNEVRFPLGVPAPAPGGGVTFQPQTDTMRNSLEPGRLEEAAAAARAKAVEIAASAPQSIQRIEQTADAAKNANFGSTTDVANFLSKVGYATGWKPGEGQTANSIVDKMTTLLAGDTTSALGQTANAALQTLKDNLPNRTMTKDAFAEMMGTLLGIQKHAQAVADLRNGAKTNVGIESTPGFKALTQDGFVRQGVNEVRQRMGLPPLPEPGAQDAHLSALKAAAEAEMRRRAALNNGMPQP